MIAVAVRCAGSPSPVHGRGEREAGPCRDGLGEIANEEQTTIMRLDVNG
jgi:hypothetical protein